MPSCFGHARRCDEKKGLDRLCPQDPIFCGWDCWGLRHNKKDADRQCQTSRMQEGKVRQAGNARLKCPSSLVATSSYKQGQCELIYLISC